MPELPEVEVGARLLRARLLGEEIHGVERGTRRPLRGQDDEALHALVGRSCLTVGRHGKLLELTFSGRADAQRLRLYCHFAMSGAFLYREAGEAPLPSRRFSLRLRSGACVDHLSQRGFGWILIQGEDAPPPREREKLGPDAYQLCAVPSQFQAHLRAVASRRGIKAALLDQSCLAGVGNIYALEGLFHASIHPAAKIESISDAALEMLAEGIYLAMRATLDAHQSGEPIRYNSGVGAESPFQCYGRAGFPCHRCGTTLMLLRQGGRRSDLCPRCQSL